MENKTMTKTAVRQLVSPPAASGDGGSLMLIIERAAQDAAFDVGKLQALLEMRERWSKEEARKSFVVALTNFKANPPEVLKTKHVSFSAGGGKTSYNHADLASASYQIGAALAEHGLSHRWNVEQTKEGRIAVTCILTHVMGHSESVRMESAADQSGGKNNIQAIGSATSYLQRYTLFAAAGVIAKEQGDDDGASTGPRSEPATPPAGPKAKTQEPKKSDTFTVDKVTTTDKEGKKTFCIYIDGQRYETCDKETAEACKKWAEDKTPVEFLADGNVLAEIRKA